jgi:flagellar biosynthesis/type III secretory pathway M-ring protein FliF/YscJ
MDTFETFDGSKPNLISSRTLKDIEIKLSVPDHDNGKNRILDGIGSFYSNYVEPNLWALIVISLLIIYLTIRYILKKDREEREEEEEKQEKKREKNKQHMLKANPEEVIKESSETPDMADIISDDYLLTEDEDENNIETNRLDAMDKLMDRGSPQDIDRVARIMFGLD